MYRPSSFKLVCQQESVSAYSSTTYKVVSHLLQFQVTGEGDDDLCYRLPESTVYEIGVVKRPCTLHDRTLLGRP
jgi:hypothetical protein